MNLLLSIGQIPANHDVSHAVSNKINLLEDAKGISAFNGRVDVRHCLIVDSTVGISAKADASSTATVFIHDSTLHGNQTNLLAQRKSNAPGPAVDYRITNSVIWGSPDSVRSDFAPTNFTIGYCNISEPWPGTGNLMADPLFVDAAAKNFRLQAGSPCIDSGNPLSPPDADGTRADMGYFAFQHVASVPPMITQPHSRRCRFGIILSPIHPLYHLNLSLRILSVASSNPIAIA